MANKKVHIKKGDLVRVISGKASKAEKVSDREGRVLQVFPKTDRALVEGINLVKKHTKPNQQYPEGGIIEQEAPIHISNLMLVDPKAKVPTRTGRKRDENGKLVRYSKKTGDIV